MTKLKEIGQAARKKTVWFLSGGPYTVVGKEWLVMAIGWGLVAAWWAVLTFTYYDASLVLWLGLFFLYSWIVHKWIEWEPANDCPGPRAVYPSPSGESTVSMCHGCESWVLAIRGEVEGHGKGRDSLIAALDKAAVKYQPVSGLAGELRSFSEGLTEKATSLTLDGTAELRPSEEEMESLIREQMPDPIRALMEAAPMVRNEDGSINEAAIPILADPKDIADFHEWQAEREAKRGVAEAMGNVQLESEEQESHEHADTST